MGSKKSTARANHGQCNHNELLLIQLTIIGVMWVVLERAAQA